MIFHFTGRCGEDQDPTWANSPPRCLGPHLVGALPGMLAFNTKTCFLLYPGAEEVWESRVGRRGMSTGPHLSSKGALWHDMGGGRCRPGQVLAVATPLGRAWGPGQPRLPVPHPRRHQASPHVLRRTMESHGRVRELQSY